jgi:hypothetical protein
VLRYLLNTLLKNSARDMINALQNWKDDVYLNHIYSERAKINWARKHLFPKKTTWT